MVEKRKHKRLKVLSYLSAREKDTGRAVGRVMDMTADGMCLHGEERLTPDATCQLIMAVNRKKFPRREVGFDARVVWSRLASAPNQYVSGIQLIDMHPEDSEAIERLVLDATFEHGSFSATRSRPQEH